MSKTTAEERGGIALAKYQSTFPDGCVGTETIPDDFMAGWNAREAEVDALERRGTLNVNRFKAICRLLEGSGDMTPVASRQIIAVVEAENAISRTYRG